MTSQHCLAVGRPGAGRHNFNMNFPGNRDPEPKLLWRRILAGLMAVAVLILDAIPVAAEVPAARQQRPVALTGGTVHPVTSEPVENATLLFADGKIIAVGTDVTIPDDAERIDVSGKHVYPGMFEAHSQLGLTEIGQVQATIDTSETGDLNPNVRSLVALNPDSELIPVTRSSGVLLAVTAPTGGLVAGQSAVIQLDGWTWEDMCLKDGASMQVNWPSLRARRSRNRDNGDRDPAARYLEQVKQLRDLFDEARACYAGRLANADQQPPDLRLEAMIPVLTGEMPLMVRAETARQIQDAVALAADYQVRLIILGGYDAQACSALLKKYDVPVIVPAVQRRPLRRHAPFDDAWRKPAELAGAEIDFCISSTDRSSTWNTRILPDQAGMAVAWGLSPETALKAVTLYPAQIMGVADMVGSLEAGKHATLFVADGDALEITTNVLDAWIQGRRVDLTNRHKRLYEKYRQKYQQLDDSRGP